VARPSAHGDLKVIAAGLDVVQVQRQAGHARPSITLDVYSHVVPAMQEDAAERVAALFGAG